MQLNYILLNLCRPYHQTQQLVSRKFVRITTCDENVLMLQHNKPCYHPPLLSPLHLIQAQQV